MAPLLGFNLGVEAGQLALVLAFYPVLYAIHRSRHRRPIVVACSVMGACLGLFWLLERLGVIKTL
jgi:UDP-N-acetylmuramyl pentapeptide phosphotransferase/UDP-N-acetylglucosamine-1-phosphate transferase